METQKIAEQSREQADNGAIRLWQTQYLLAHLQEENDGIKSMCFTEPLK